ncbi:TonB-dependent receptor [Prevotella sp. E9-3]|uniref:TonB-dependent receptor n=1 Tax=Prevotella sp. E9-3 TaxID=2913621 RepID=UPI001EDAB3C6|nr:TonB-dependent receptor [Prevotella sp. E9-3]UKK49240.1 TonB-dependent receptor [Prevotella sp. E9-3]
MIKKLKLLVMALSLSPVLMAQEVDSLARDMQSEQAFTFTEAQLSEDDDVTQNITVISSNRNVYASEVGYRFSPARFKYRAFNSKYTDMYINGNPVNDAERGEFRYSFVGGLNNQTRGSETTLPFEDNNFMMAGMGGASNYNFRPSSFATGQRASIAGANRNYNTRAMYTYNTGVTEKGWAFTGSLTYRWGNGTGFVEGTSYNSLSYFLGIEKILNDRHSLSLVTWGNPTERGTQTAATDEMYWIANDRQYNPAWGYQDGKKRNSRIVKDFAPAALFTWDFTIDDNTKLTTTLLGKYSMYSSSRLNYNNSTNPAPDYYSNMPSYFFDVYAPYDGDRDDMAMANWQTAYDYLSASKANRQIGWDRMYFANRMVSLQGGDAMYYLQRYHDDQLALSLASHLEKSLSQLTKFHAGVQLSTNKGMHYQTMDDLLGATSFHNANTYVIKNYGEGSTEAQYDLNNPNQEIGKGDRFGYDYNILVNKAQAWAGISSDFEVTHLFLNGRIGGTTMQRDGKMRNGLAPNNSYGKSGTAKFVDGGFKAGAHVNLGQGNAMLFGLGYEVKTPAPNTAFIAAQVNNDFVKDLKQEKIFSTEIGYRLQNSWLQANLNAFYSHLYDVTEQSMYYMDDRHSFTYVSLNGIEKEYYGLELGLNFKMTEWLNLKALGTISDAQYVNNANVTYMLSEDGKTYDDVVLNKGMREGCTPLSAASLDLSIHTSGWFIDLIGNYYDRIYLYYTPVTRYKSHQSVTYDNDGNEVMYNLPDQAKGKGGFMLDASIGKSFFLRHGRRIGFNLMLTNILNNTKLVTGGREQSRTDVDENGESIRTYSFQNSPYKFYANGINGMFMINYYF